jgi:nucleoid DNA-binding protein
MAANEFQGLPDINEYLTGRGNQCPVTVPELGEIVEKVSSRTKLSEEQANQVVKLFFQEIRGHLLRDGMVDISFLGRFSISSPKTSGTKRKVFPKFKAKRSLIKRMNDV